MVSGRNCGTGSVRTGGNDQSVYGMLTKTVEFNEKFALQGYVGAASVFKDFNQPFSFRAYLPSF